MFASPIACGQGRPRPASPHSACSPDSCRSRLRQPSRRLWRQPRAAAQAGGAPITFTDVTTAAGIRFGHTNGAFGKKHLPETMGSGVVIFDADGDGDQDLFLSNGRNWPGQPASGLPAFYKNNGTGGFVESTRGGGPGPADVRHGRAAADYDNDGDTDLFTTGVDGNHLFKNNGAGVFTDVIATSGLAPSTGFATSAAWADYDKDGALDLLVVNYVDVVGGATDKTQPRRQEQALPHARGLQGRQPVLYKGGKDGRFADVTKAAGLVDPQAGALDCASTTTRTAGSICPWPTTRGRTGSTSPARAASSTRR